MKDESSIKSNHTIVTTKPITVLKKQNLYYDEHSRINKKRVTRTRLDHTSITKSHHTIYKLNPSSHR